MEVSVEQVVSIVKISLEIYEYYGRIQVIYDTGFSTEVVSAETQDIKDLFEEMKKIMEDKEE